MSSQHRLTRRISSSGRFQLAEGVVRDRLNNMAQWQHYTADGKWLCPYCLRDIRAPRSGKNSMINHIDSHLLSRCAGFNEDAGPMKSDEDIKDRLLSLHIENQARSDTAWQVFDHEGFWYSPASLKKVPSVRIVNGLFDGFTVQQMVQHLKSCPYYAAERMYSVEHVHAARDQGIRIHSLATNLQRVVTQNIWKLYSPNGWLCPYCTSSVPHIQQQHLAHDTLENIATHLMADCVVYKQDPRAITNELTLLNILKQAQHAPVASALPVAAPIATALPVATPIAAAAPVIAAPIIAAPIIAAAPQQQALTRTNITPKANIHIPLSDEEDEFEPSTPSTPAAMPLSNALQAQETAPSTPVNKASIDSELNDFISGFDADDAVLPAAASRDAQWVTRSTSRHKHHQAESRSIKPTEKNAFDWMEEEAEEKETPSQKNAIAINTDLIRAKSVQEGLLNACPHIPGFTFATRYEACSTVSGDFYEFSELDDGRLIFAQGDVSGHGVEAGLIMSMARKTLSIFARQGGTPTEVLCSMNDALIDDLKGQKFITLCYAELKPSERTITWLRAGHNPVMHYNLHTKEFKEIKPGGMVVGLKGGKLFRQLLKEETVPVQSGDVYLVYTDGINETMNRQGEEYGFERMQHIICDHAARGPEALLDRLMDSIRQFRGAAPADDDLTLLALAVD